MNTHQNQPYLQNLSTQSLHILSDTVIIGRHQDCNLVLKSEKGASRKHARITVQNGAVVLMDLGSLNGTMVNGREISRAVQLTDGDIVIFDEQEYRFTGPANNALSGSENVTVIANKDEIGRPDRIKPAIRLVDAAPAAVNDNPNVSSFDDTASWDSLTSGLDQMQSAEQAEQLPEQSSGHSDNLALQAQAANDQQPQENLVEKPQLVQEHKPQDLHERDPQQKEPQDHDSQAPMSLAQGSHGQSPLAQVSPVPGSQAQDVSEAPGTHSPEPKDWQSPGKQMHANEQHQDQDPYTFQWNADDEPQINNRAAHEHQPAQQPMHQPANGHQPGPAAPVPAPSRDRNSAQRADFFKEQDRHAPFRATSRPGGDERSTRPGLQKLNPYNSPRPKRRINWALWFIVIPLIALLVMGAIYLAYTAGYSAGNTGGSSGFS